MMFTAIWCIFIGTFLMTVGATGNKWRDAFVALAGLGCFVVGVVSVIALLYPNYWAMALEIK